LEKCFLTDIPKMQDYGSRAVCDWVKDKVSEYLGQLRSGKERIEENQIKVEPPQVQAAGDYDWPEGGQLTFKDKVELSFMPSSNGTKVYVAEGNSDPTDASSNRQLITEGQPILVSDNKTIKYAVQDSEGNWSPVQRVQVVNANKEFVPAVSTANVFGQRRV